MQSDMPYSSFVNMKFSTNGSSAAVFVNWGTGVAIVDTTFFEGVLVVTLGVAVIPGVVVEIAEVVLTEAVAVVGTNIVGVGAIVDAAGTV